MTPWDFVGLSSSEKLANRVLLTSGDLYVLLAIESHFDNDDKARILTYAGIGWINVDHLGAPVETP